MCPFVHSCMHQLIEVQLYGSPVYLIQMMLILQVYVELKANHLCVLLCVVWIGGRTCKVGKECLICMHDNAKNNIGRNVPNIIVTC